MCFPPLIRNAVSRKRGRGERLDQILYKRAQGQGGILTPKSPSLAKTCGVTGVRTFAIISVQSRTYPRCYRNPVGVCERRFITTSSPSPTYSPHNRNVQRLRTYRHPVERTRPGFSYLAIRTFCVVNASSMSPSAASPAVASL